MSRKLGFVQAWFQVKNNIFQFYEHKKHTKIFTVMNSRFFNIYRKQNFAKKNKQVIW